MPNILLCSLEGAGFQYQNNLSTYGADSRRRGSVILKEDYGTEMNRKFSSGYSNLWLHVRMAQKDNSGSYFAGSFRAIEVLSGTEPLFAFAIYDWGSNRYYRHLARVLTPLYDGSGDLKWGNESLPMAPDRFNDYDFNIRIDGSQLTVDVYFDGTLRDTVVSNSGGAISLPDTLNLKWIRSNRYSSGGFTAYQDIIVSDGIPTVGMELSRMVPAASGEYTDFDGDYSDLDMIGYDPGDGINASAVGQKESWFSVSDPIRKKSKKVYGTGVNFVAQADSSVGVSDFEPFIRIGSTDHMLGPLGAGDSFPKPFFVATPKNPATLQEWTVDELSQLQYGIRTI